MMDELNSYRLSTLQKKHPYLSQLNNWTSKESSTGFLDSEFTDNKEEIVSGLEETKTNKLWFVKPLKSNKIKPLSSEEVMSATSKLPSLEILSSTKGSGLLEKQAECVAQLNMKPLPKIESHFDERTKAESEDSKEESRKSNLYESKTDAKQNDDELSITHEVTHEVDHELSKQRDSRRPSKRAGIIRALKMSAAAVFVISLAVIICIKTFGESSENFASKTNNSSGRSGSAEARKEYSGKEEKEVLLNEERTDHHVIVSKMETPKLNSVTQSLYVSLSDNELRYAVTPHLEKVNSKGVTQSHDSTNFSKGPVLSFLIAQTITVTQSHGYSDFRHRNIVTQSYGSTHFRNEPMPSFLGVQGNALTHGSSDVRHSNAVTQSHGSTDFLFAASSSPVTLYHLSDFRHSNIVTQSHGSTGFLTRLVPSPLVVPSNSRVEFLLSFATPSNAVTQSLEANTRPLSSLFVDPSNAVTQSLQVNTESINSEYGKCQEGDFHRHPVHCTKYLRCNHGKWQERNCGRGAVFNPKINVCDWDRNVQC